MIKAVKKFKFWSRKKKKKKSHYIPYQYVPPPPPPTAYHHCYCSYTSTQPSAPPLPPWLEVEQTHHEAIFAAEVQPPPQFPPQHTVLETSSDTVYSTSAAADETTSYQQYVVANPVYGVPAVRTERSGGLFGCVVEIGKHKGKEIKDGV